MTCALILDPKNTFIVVVGNFIVFIVCIKDLVIIILDLFLSSLLQEECLQLENYQAKII